MSWNQVIFESIFKIQTKNGLTKPSRIRGEGYKFINMGELFAIDRMYDPKMELVPLSETEKITHKIEKGDLLFARQSLVASGAGKCSIVKEVDDLTVFDSHIIRVRLNQEFCDSDFYYYYFKSSVNNLKSLVQQGVQAGIRASDLSKLKVHYPPLETQKRIASILSTYDDLIENNLKRIKLLEETAQNIYKEWFVNFRFPNYEHTEFDAESGLPVGWQKINLYDFVEIKMGFPFKGEDFNEVNIGKPAIRIRDIPSSWTRTHTTQEVSEEYIVEQGDILIGMDGFFYLDIWRGQKGYLVQRVCRIRANEQNLQGFLLESLRQPISYYEKTISGATVAHLGAKHLKEIFINVPKDSQLLEELKVFNRLNSQKINLSNQNQKLKEARDILLPRLMNRTIEV